jgi:type II secretory pathway pseudopilin PulG
MTRLIQFIHRYRPPVHLVGVKDSGDGGWSLIEVMVAMTVSAIAIALIAPVLTTVTNVTSSANSVTNGSAQARQTMDQMSADIGSTTSNNVCFPSAALTAPPSSTFSSSGTSGYPLVVLSNVYGSCTWFQWTVNASSQLTQQLAAKGASSWGSAVPLISPLTNASSQTLFNHDTTNSLMNIQVVTRGSTTTAVNGTTGSTKPNSQSVALETSVGLFTSSQSSGAGAC